jgi:hypothetical protein
MLFIGCGLIKVLESFFFPETPTSNSPWAFFVVNNGDCPNCDEVQQVNFNICFPQVIPLASVEKKQRGRKGSSNIQVIWDKFYEPTC